MAHSHKHESKSSRSGKLRSLGMGGGQGRSGKDNAAAFDGGMTMSSADQAPAGAMPTNTGTDTVTAGMYRRGGKVKGAAMAKRLDRVARKSGGRVCKADGGEASKDLGSGGSDKKTVAQRKADAPLKPKKPQELDTGSMPLFGDSAKQGSLFKRGGKVKMVKDTDRDGHARGGKVNAKGVAGQDDKGSTRSMSTMQAKRQTGGPAPKFARGGEVKGYTNTKTPVAASAKSTNISRRFAKASGGGMRSEKTEAAKAAANFTQAQKAYRDAPEFDKDAAGSDMEGANIRSMRTAKETDDSGFKRGGSPKREKRAAGGKVMASKKGGSTVNVIIAPQGGMGASAPPPPPPPIVPSAGPPPAPPMQAGPGGPGGPPPGGPAPGGQMAPGGFKRGGRVSASNPLGEAGQHSGQGRLNQAKFYARQGD